MDQVPENPPPDARTTVLLRVAKLVGGGRETLCVILDTSARGLKVKLFAGLPHHEDLAIELANGDRHPVDCTGVAADHADLIFREPVLLDHLIAEARGGDKRHHIRLNIALAGTLYSTNEPVPVMLRNISSQGAAFDCERWLAIDQAVRIETAALPPLYATVRWRDPPQYGIVFERIFPLEELAKHCTGLPALP